MLKRFINDLISGLWVVIGLLFALLALPSGSETQSTMTALFLGLTLVWLATGPLRWKDGD